MPQGFHDVLASARGFVCCFLLLVAIALLLAGVLSADQWISFTQWLVAGLLLARTVTGTVDRFIGTPPPTPTQNG
jgi:hypothetical protein